MNKRTKPRPTDEQILSYDNVPVYIAASYTGQGQSTLSFALQKGLAPFGYAVECEGSWAYNISPGLLVKYKRGDLPTYRLEEVQAFAVEAIERLLTVRLEAAKKALDWSAA